MKKGTTRRALLLSALSLLLCVSMLVGTTFAWFTDSVTSAGNIIQSGNLDVEMFYADGKEDPDTASWNDASSGAIFNNDLWEPGYTEVRHIKIHNKGTLALKYKVNILANGEVSKLADVIDVYYADPAVQVADRNALANAPRLGTLTDVLEQLGQTGNGELIAGATDVITIAFKMQESAGNEYQDLSIGSDFSVVLTATQLTHEEDSFDDQYDKDAENPVYTAPARRPATATEDVVLGDETVEVELPKELVNDLPSAITGYTLRYTDPKADPVNDTVIVSSADLVDQDLNAVNLSGNTTPITVKLYVGDGFTQGQWVKIFHDDEEIASCTVDAEGYITYEALHFCKITVTDNIFYINTAEELIQALSAIRTRAKAVIPGETGNKAYRENAVFVLENDIEVTDGSNFMYTDSNGAPFHFYGVKGTLDLNGHTITVTADALLSGKQYANAALLFQYSNMEIIGDGRIIAQNRSKAIYAWANCTVDIYGGTYISNSSERNCAAVYVNNATATINVYGGTYTETAYAFNAHDSSCANAAVIVLHEGITYADFLKNGTTDVIASDIAGGRIVMAENCELSQYEENGIAMNKVVTQ